MVISSWRFEILQSENFGADADEIGQVEQVELLQVLIRDFTPW